MHFFLGRVTVICFLVVSWMLLVCQLNAQPAENKEQPLMTFAPIDGNLPPPGSISNENFIDILRFNVYQAILADDLSLCQNNAICLKRVKRMKSWVCAVAVCDRTDQSKEMVDCFEEILGQASPGVQDQISSSMCHFIRNPSVKTRQNLLAQVSDSSEDDLVEYVAYLFALEGSSVSCEDCIKNYVGAYGTPQWNYKWFRVLSGCRILAHESTREQEEKDFYQWFSVLRQEGDLCSDIVNSELRHACSKGAKFFSSEYGR